MMRASLGQRGDDALVERVVVLVQEPWDADLMAPVALAMAAAHLRGGRDVIMPQYLGRLGEIERFGAVARDNGAAFCEIAVMDDRHQALARFYLGRDDDDKAGWHHTSTTRCPPLGTPRSWKPV